MVRYTLVEICPINHPKAEKLREANRDLGHAVFRYRGRYIIVIGGDRVWVAENMKFEGPGDGIYCFELDDEENGARTGS